MKILTSSFVFSAASTLLLLLCLQVGEAQVRTSSNYQLQSDSINIGGGFSSSTNFVQESTLGEIATGRSDSATYSLRAGYQQMQPVYIAMTAADNVVMDTSLPGITGGTSNGTTSVVVTTDSPSGYSLTIKAANSPAMQSGAYSIADYVQGTSSDFVFTTGSSDAHFGYTPSGAEISQYFKDDGANCGVGTGDIPLTCWAGLSTAPFTIAQTTNANHPSGATTTLNFRVGLGGVNNIPAGLYIATTTLTALPL